jgi:hypothetical protein
MSVMSKHTTSGRELLAADLEAVVGGAVPAAHTSLPGNQPNLLVVIAIIAILIG